MSRLSCRRAWYLADRIGLRLQDYEYHRQDELIQRWLKREVGLSDAGAFQRAMERAQRAVFLHITREPDGKRAILSRLHEKAYKTFPQYAMERMTSAGLMPDAEQRKRTVHFFGFTHISELHARTIAWLATRCDVRFYHLNVLTTRVAGDLAETAQSLRQWSDAEERDRGRELLRLWGRAGAEALGIVSNMQQAGGFETTPVPTIKTDPHAKVKPARSATVLERFRDYLLHEKPTTSRLPQDTTLQIVGCPGVAREVETVYNSIIHNLQADPTLRQTDIAVVATDLASYRAALQAAFERPPKRFLYSLVDFSAEGLSMFGQAVLGMLDLALESFSRSAVFQVLLNPCFLARLGASRTQATIWLEWAESLGICQGWDADEKEQQGFPRSPFYAWRLGLQRLRLGRYMATQDDEDGAAAPRFGHVLPFADMESGDREQLDAFCRAVEGLLPTLARFRFAAMSGEAWGRAIARLVQEFLDVPADRPEESQVRAELLSGLTDLGAWDALRDSAGRKEGLPLALVREYVHSQLEVLAGSQGEYLVGGVTVCGLQSMRPVPFQIVYILGLGENTFPGSNTLSSFDLRGVQRLPGDVRPAETRLYDFLATCLSAQRKLYLLYNHHDLQKDQPLLPAVPIAQLQRFLSQNVLQSEMQIVAMPMRSDDPRYLDAAQQPGYQDVLVQVRDADRNLALLAARQNEGLSLDAKQEAEWQRKQRDLRRDFTIPASDAEPASVPIHVHLSELKRFLQLPASASLKRHLGIDEDGERTLDDDEPLVTTDFAAAALIRQAIRQLVESASTGGVEPALAAWRDRFADLYADSRLRSRVPEEAFGEIDRAAILADLQERIHGQGQIEAFLREHADMKYCGPVLMGENLTPLGARLRLPALTLRPGQELAADARAIRLSGSTPFAWHAPGRFEILIVSNGK
ncbi:MAG: exodeoxyribonuclease V subunit gamma, partial [Planctomycetes bacterium]|nr:exodeoxyribonuclease V subunit gamma [Planctomycetota bacterium]